MVRKGTHGRKVVRRMSPKYITIHSTQNYSAGAAKHSLALKNGALRSPKTRTGNRIGYLIWHFTVDDREAIQHMPTNEQGEHADFHGPGNTQSIGIEMCEQRGSNRSVTIERTAKLTAVLMKQKCIPLCRVVPHYHWPREGYTPAHKDCPHFLLENGQPHYSANETCFWPLKRDDREAEFDEYLTTALSRDAARFVKESDKPFCLYLAYNAPHMPFEAPKETVEKYAHIENKQRRIYAAMIDEMDRGIGMVIDALKESGKYDNTLIFFLSDNGGAGGPEKVGKHKNNTSAFSDSGPFRDGKGSMREGGCHVPFIMHWPAGIKRTGSFDGLVSALDIAATAVALGDGDTSGKPLEGVNLIPFLNGEKEDSPHDALFWRTNNNSRWAVRTVATKYLSMDSKSSDTELYDMSVDPCESNNIVSEAPEKRAEMAKLWNEWNADNINNIFLESGNYQKKRLQMYQELAEKLEQDAKKRKAIIIK